MKVYPNKYCVYYHKDGDKVFYVGCGRIHRAFEFGIRTGTWANYVASIGYEYDVEIVKWFRLRKSAEKFEMEEIIRLKSICNRENRYGMKTPLRFPKKVKIL